MGLTALGETASTCFIREANQKILCWCKESLFLSAAEHIGSIHSRFIREALKIEAGLCLKIAFLWHFLHTSNANMRGSSIAKGVVIPT